MRANDQLSRQDADAPRRRRFESLESCNFTGPKARIPGLFATMVVSDPSGHTYSAS